MKSGIEKKMKERDKEKYFEYFLYYFMFKKFNLRGWDG